MEYNYIMPIAASAVPTPPLFLTSQQKGKGIRTINVNLDRGMFFPEVERIYATLSQAAIPYQMLNISQEAYENACFQVEVSDSVGILYNVLLDDGTYPSLTELEQAMNYALNQSGIPGFPVDFPAFNIADRSTYPILLDGNTTTGEVIVTVPNPILAEGQEPLPNLITQLSFTCSNRVEFNGQQGTADRPSKLFQELGFKGDETLTTGTAGNQLVSTEPVTFLDYIASGIYVVVEGDLQVLSFYNDFANANVLANIAINNDDVLGALILYPRDLQTINCPMVESKTLRNFKIRFVSPRDPTRDIIFTQGDCSLTITFDAVY